MLRLPDIWWLVKCCLPYPMMSKPLLIPHSVLFSSLRFFFLFVTVFIFQSRERKEKEDQWRQVGRQKWASSTNLLPEMTTWLGHPWVRNGPSWAEPFCWCFCFQPDASPCLNLQMCVSKLFRKTKVL